MVGENRAFNPSELEGRGIYQTVGTSFGYPYAVADRLTTPLTPRENMLRFFGRQPLCWYPDMALDLNDVYNENIPDNIAIEFAGGIDSFGVEWQQVGDGTELPAFVRPGNPKLKDITQWRELAVPDPSSWDWAAAIAKYQPIFEPDRLTRAVVVCGIFERLIALMDFEGAAIACLEEPDEVKALLERVRQYNLYLIDRYAQDFKVDLILFHDDWSARRGPFMSISLIRDILLPELKSVVERTHEQGLLFTFHSCGNAISLLPLMIEAGVDCWQLDYEAVKDELPAAIEQYGNQILFEAYMTIEGERSDEDVQQDIIAWLRTLCASGRMMLTFDDGAAYIGKERSFDLRRFVYEQSRRLAQGA
jgi:hypothetical protein